MCYLFYLDVGDVVEEVDKLFLDSLVFKVEMVSVIDKEGEISLQICDKTTIDLYPFVTTKAYQFKHVPEPSKPKDP